MSSKKAKIEKALVALGELKPEMVIPIKKLETALNLKSDDPQFGWMVSELRHTLCNFGLYLSGEGSSKTHAYSILPTAENRWIAELSIARAERDLETKQTLLANTNLEGFSELQVARHEGSLRRISLKLAAMAQAESFESELKKRRPARKKETEVEAILIGETTSPSEA
jgi:hypothetical protein